ncbi:MAG: hypothetical protein J7L23_00325 [Candidatus Diapherotrites archaeon]|nr:hypothetical protein [Candidatus Diapherotrites archaeon]
MRIRKEDFFIGVVLVAIALFGRTVFHIAPNVEFVTASALLAGVFIKSRYYWLVPLTTMVLSDAIIGNTLIFVFTWSAFLLPAFLGRYIKQWKESPFKLMFSATTGGVFFSLLFFLWTNFGVWLLGWYPPTLAGLLQSYIMALPFLRLNLLGNLVIVPSMFLIVLCTRSLVVSIARSVQHTSWVSPFLAK